MRRGRTIVVALAMLGLALPNIPAQAASVTSAADSSVAAPAISPAAERVTHVGRYDFADYNCRSGRACLAVWDDTTGNWKVFDLYQCRSYRLSYWNDLGGLKNNQTGGAAVRTYGSGGGLIGTYSPRGNEAYEVNWTPVWNVRPC